MPVIPFGDSNPEIAAPGFIAPDAWVIGDVSIKANVSIFFGAVLRGDIEPIEVGEETNIQEHALLHTSHGLGPCLVGQRVTVGHRAILHGCRVEDQCIVGMGATLLDGAVIGANSVIGAQSLVPMNANIPSGVLALGVPARVKRELTPEELAQLQQSARGYVETGKAYAQYFGTV